MSIFDAIRLADDLEEAVLDTLRGWWLTYAREVELQQGFEKDDLVYPKTWLKANELDSEAGSALPTLVVISPGMSARNKPKQEGDGSFRVWFSVAIGVFVAADNRKNTMRLTRIYTAIARTIMLQKQSLGGFAQGTEWFDESYDDNFPFPDGKTISAGQVAFDIEIDGTVNRFGGPGAQIPPDPDNQPGSNWPLVEEVNATVEVKES